MAETRPPIGFIGAGRVASALAVALERAGYRVVAVASRTPGSADALAARLRGARVCLDPQAVVDSAGLVFLTVPDRAIEPVVASLRWSKGVAAVHTSGAESRAALLPAELAGAETGALHPLQTFAATVEQDERLAGITFALEARGRLRETLLRVVEDLDASAIELTAAQRTLYHASAVLVSNYVVTLVKLATDLWPGFGVDRRAAVHALLPLLQGTVENIEHVGVPAALTGPIERGDLATVECHLQALAAAPAVLRAYIALARSTVQVAVEKGTLNAASAESFRRILEEQDPNEYTE
jgi:predicted short-subunit dehydrogenase-like oxidoreductase (DUF2520 family)